MTIEVLDVTTTDTEANYGNGAIRIFSSQPQDITTDTHVIVKGWALEVVGGTPVRMVCDKHKCARCTTPDCPGMPNPVGPTPPPVPNMAFRKADADFSTSRVAFRSTPPIGPALVMKWQGTDPSTIEDIAGTVYDWLSSQGETFDQSIAFHVYAVTADAEDATNVLDRTMIAIPVRRFTPPPSEQ